MKAQVHFIPLAGKVIVNIFVSFFIQVPFLFKTILIRNILQSCFIP